MPTATRAGRAVTYLPDVVDDGLGETTSEDTEGSEDGTKCVDPHEVDLSLESEVQKVGMCVASGIERRAR